MSRYRLTRRAIRDFDTIIDDLDNRSRTAAKRIAAAIHEQCRRYAESPLIGVIRDDLAPDLRCFMAFRYIVFYTVISGGIEIARIFHGHQDIEPDMFPPKP
jgi:toxin ParE1/3/4